MFSVHGTRWTLVDSRLPVGLACTWPISGPRPQIFLLVYSDNSDSHNKMTSDHEIPAGKTRTPNQIETDDGVDTGYLNQFGGLNAGYVADLIERYVKEPGSVPNQDRDLLHSVDAAIGRAVYQRPDSADAGTPASGEVDVRRLSRLLAYIDAIRNYGYREADLDPLGLRARSEPLLDPATHGITEGDQAAPAAQAATVAGGTSALKFGASVAELTAALREMYCGTSGYEFSHIRSTEERAWLRSAIEASRYRSFISPDQKRLLLDLLTRGEVFEQYLHKAFSGQRWFSLEGCESLLVVADQIVLQAAYSGVRNIVVGMSHRGRLNLLTHMFGKPYEAVLTEFMHGHYDHEGDLHGGDRGWMTDVKYHMGARTARDIDGDGVTDISLTLLPNPSHLEMVNPVVQGAVRAVQDQNTEVSAEHSAMSVLIHGDAAFAGQGIVAETLNLTNLKGYRTSGAIHIIVNNQVGFTTDPGDSFSTEHASDLGRGYDIPVAHVNADDVEACVAVAKLAVAYRQTFKKDFIIDLVGYRRFGHNENDEPSFTQPVMYRAIERHPTTRALWAESLVKSGIVSGDAPANMVSSMFAELELKKDSAAAQVNGKHWAATEAQLAHSMASTAVAHDVLVSLNRLTCSPPPGFTPHPRITRILERRREAFESGKGIDWAHAEILALGSILKGGTNVRLAGQDTERGTFSQRHAVLRDYETGVPHISLGDVGGARFDVFNSPLSEQAVLAFEYGYSATSARTLVIWEAQFGDFINNAQSIVDELIASGRAKWGQQSGIVLLLPHGYEGQGANHSYAHLHTFLALASDNNMRIAYPTTAAQYFHLLRSQALRVSSDPRPLVVMAPKSLLRHPIASSSVAELTGGAFQPAILTMSPEGTGQAVDQLVLCSGKVYSDLASADEYASARNTAVIRVEQLYPFPGASLVALVGAQLKHLKRVVWVQEEPQNRGPWTFVAPLLSEVFGPRQEVEYVGRPAMPSPAEGAHWLHGITQGRLIKRALGVE